MTFQETLEWQRVNSHHINRLANLGDALAAKLIAAYRDLYNNKLDPAKQTEWMRVCDEYARRDLTITERDELLEHFGHKEPVSLRRLDS